MFNLCFVRPIGRCSDILSCRNNLKTVAQISCCAASSVLAHAIVYHTNNIPVFSVRHNPLTYEEYSQCIL